MDDRLADSAKSSSVPEPEKETIAGENGSERGFQAPALTIANEKPEVTALEVMNDSSSKPVARTETIQTPLLSENLPSKIADRPHFWTIALGVLAIAISVLSYLQSRKALELSTGIARAAVQVSSARLVNKPEDSPWLRYDLTVTNFGQVTARNIVPHSQFDVSQFEVPITTSLYEHPRATDMVTKFSQTIRLQANRRFSSYAERLAVGNKTKLLISGDIEYTDDITGIRSKDNWCFVYDPNDEEQTRTLELRRCEYQP